MRIVAISILLLLTGIIGVRLFHLNTGRLELVKEREELQKKLDALRTENTGLEENLEYLSNVQNLEKDIKSLFHYKNPGERLIILVPQDE